MSPASPATSPSTSRRRSRPRPPPTSRSSRPVSRARRPTSQQGLYWQTGHIPMLKYVMNTYHPDLLLAGFPTTDEFQHQFLGLVSPKLPTAPPTRPTTTSTSTACPMAGSRRARHSSAPPTRAPTTTLTHGTHRSLAATRSPSSRPTTASGRSSSRSTPASRSSTSACCPSRRPRTAARRVGETIGRAKACWAGGALQVYLNVVGPRPGDGQPRLQADPGGRRRRDGHEDPRRRSRPSPIPTTGPTTASPRAGRSSTARSPRPRRGTSRTARTARPTWPIRRGPATSSCSPTRPTSSTRRRRARSSRRPTSSASTATCRTSRTSPRNINMRATLHRRRPRHRQGPGDRAHDRPRADARVHPRHPRAPAQPGPGPDRDAQGRQLDQADLDRRAQRLPRPARPDDRHRRQQHQRPGRRGVVPGHDVRRGARRRCPARACILAGGDNVGASPANSGLLDDMPAIDVENAWGLDATSYGNHEFDYGVDRLLLHQARAHFPFLATNIVETATGQAPVVGQARRSCSPSTASRSASSAPSSSPPPSSSVAGATAGPHVPRRGSADQGRVQPAASPGRQRPGRRHPPGHGRRAQPDRQRRRRAVDGSDPGDRRPAPGHDGRRDDRRPYAPGVQPDARPHPGHRGHQRGGFATRSSS